MSTAADLLGASSTSKLLPAACPAAAVVGYRVVSAHLEHTGAWHRAFRDAETGGPGTQGVQGARLLAGAVHWRPAAAGHCGPALGEECWLPPSLLPCVAGRLVYLGDSWRYQLRYLSAYYGPQVRRLWAASALAAPPCTPARLCPAAVPQHALPPLAAAPGAQCGVTLFAGLAGWIVAGFTAYQLWLVCAGGCVALTARACPCSACRWPCKSGCCTAGTECAHHHRPSACHPLSLPPPLPAGLTAYEIHKRREVGLALELRREARDVEARAERHLAAGRGSSCRSSATDGPVGASSTALAAMAPRPQPQQQRGRRPPLPNHYHRGAWRNLSEVLFPHYHLRLAAGGGGVKKQS